MLQQRVVVQFVVCATAAFLGSVDSYCGSSSTRNSKAPQRRLLTTTQQQAAAEQQPSGIQSATWRTNRMRASVVSQIDWESDEDPWEHPCRPPLADDEENLDLDRREAVFAALGAVWALTGVGVMLLPAGAAHAVYGTDARMELPNPYQALADRATKQCLVESLGNRECLVYADDANKLYQGANTVELIGRIDKAAAALATIPELNESRKWSQITGVMAGPMGELVRNMGQVADLTENADAARQLVAGTKKNLYALQDGVNRKDQKLVLQYHAAVTNNLVAFVKAL